MKNQILSPDGKSNITRPASPVAGLSLTGIDFAACPEEVARKAYFTYVNEGSPQGRDVQHWLEAEARLIEERNRTRSHGFHHQT